MGFHERLMEGTFSFKHQLYAPDLDRNRDMNHTEKQ